MRDLEGLWKAARAELVIPAEEGGNDVFLWEHSVRVAKSAHYLARLPEVQAQEPDMLALLIAALFHEAGWISRWRAGEIKRYEILLGPPSEAIITESVRMMHHALRNIIEPPSLQRAGETIQFRTAHPSKLIEGQLLLEADNLEEFGLGFLWMAIRRGVCGGKGVQAVLDAWTRRTEYHFWTARLKDAFRFGSSRELARQRLKHLESLMTEMAIQHHVEDVRRLGTSQKDGPGEPVDWGFEPEKRGKQS